MGLFKRNKKEESEDFILDFGESGSVADTDNENDVEKLSVTLWDDRKPHHSSHAMTVDEILGNFDADEENAENPIEIADSDSCENLSAEVSVTEKENAESPAPPPEIKIEVHSEQSAAERADALISRLKKENELLSKEEPTPVETVEQAVETPPEVAEETADEVVAEEVDHTEETEPKAQPEEAVPTPLPQVEEAPAVKETTAVKATPTEPVAQKKETKLSPTAQALYDRMMAERAKMQSANMSVSTESPTESVEEEPIENAEAENSIEASLEAVESAEVSLDFEDEVVSATSDIIPETSAPEKANISDSIFDAINENIKSNPLSRKMERSTESMLSKCKTYITPKSDVSITAGSIDDIIRTAEKNARERLSNLYDVQSSQPASVISNTHEFSPFLQKTTTDSNGKTVSIPVKIQDETSDGAIISSTNGNISDFQCSFADSSDSVDTGATRIIDISSSSDRAPATADPLDSFADNRTPHVTDPIKAEVLHDLLKPITNPTDEIKIPVEPIKLSSVEESELSEAEVGESSPLPPEVEDYNSVEDAESVRTDLASQQVSVMARFIPTVVITAILSVVDIFLKNALLSASPTAFALLNIILFLVALVINFRTIKGVNSLLDGQPDIDSPTALAALCTFLYTIVSSIFGNLATVPVLTPAALLILSFNLWGKLSIIKRIRRGFEIIANSEEKKALTFVEDKLSASVMASGSVIGDALICQGKNTTNIRDYLKNSFSVDLYEKKLSPLILFTVIAGSLAALFAFFMNDGVIPAIEAFTAVACAGCPIAAIFCCNLPLSIATKKLAGYGAMLAGHPATEAIANANAIAFDAAELFPKGTIKLYNMQVLESGAVDKYIASASAILTAANSPLAPIFEEILETNNEKIPVADSIKYENNMGVSGWIEDRRILVGNRTLMEGHNIKTPNLELDKKILRQGYFPLYLACDQQLCALFVVGYEADEEITYELRNLCNTGVTMLINSNDPNVSEEMLCDYFGLYPDLVKVMSGTGVAAYKNTAAYTESVSAPASYGENISGFLSAVTSSIRMKSILTTMLIIQLLFFVLGIALTGYYIFTAGIMSLPLLGVLGFQLLGALVTTLAAHLRKP